MRGFCILIFAGLLSAALAAAPGWAAQGRVLTLNPTAKPITMKAMPLTAKFQVMSVSQLKAAKVMGNVAQTTGGLAPGIRIVKPISQTAISALASLAYSSGNGVALNAVNLLDKTTGSTLQLQGVQWDDATRQRIVGGDPTVSQWVPNSDTPYWSGYVGAQATFKNLPSGKHTYVLTLGTTADPRFVAITVSYPVFFFPTDKLTVNPATSEIRCFFVGEYKDEMSVNVAFWYSQQGINEYLETHFHHLQLAVLD
jgi:hypothetical protein